MNLARSVFALLALSASVSIGAADVPRLWEITGKNEQGAAGKFYLLPVTHNGLEVEYDEYFHKIVVPIAMKADVFMREKALITPEVVPSCPVPLANSEANREILQKAFEDVGNARYEWQGKIERPSILSDLQWSELQKAERRFADIPTRKLSEYGLIASMGEINFNMQLQQPERFQKPDHPLKPSVDDYLAFHRKKEMGKSSDSIDTVADIVDAYCKINPVNRARYLQREIKNLDPLNFTPMSREVWDRANKSFVESLRLGRLSSDFADSPDDEHSRHMVCDRNEKWIRIFRTTLNTGTAFYALGMAHVLQPGLLNQKRCNGLLTALKDEGFNVRLIPFAPTNSKN